MEYLGFIDLLKRWGKGRGNYSRNGLYYLMRAPDFPLPAMVLNEGRTKVWDEDEIVEFELSHPEVLDEGIKLAKVRAYARCARLKKRSGS